MQALRGTKEVQPLIDALAIDATNPAIVLTQAGLKYQARCPLPSARAAPRRTAFAGCEHGRRNRILSMKLIGCLLAFFCVLAGPGAAVRWREQREGKV